MTSTGFVILDCENLEALEAQNLFGSGGVCPPKSLLSLLAGMLNDMSAAPDETDAAELRSLSRDLKTSLAQVETMIARLEG